MIYWIILGTVAAVLFIVVFSAVVLASRISEEERQLYGDDYDEH